MSIFSNVLLEEAYDFDYMIESINMDSIYINESFTDNIKAIWNKFKKWLKEKIKIIRDKIRKIISKVKKNKDNDDNPNIVEYYTCDDTLATKIINAFYDFDDNFDNLTDNMIKVYLLDDFDTFKNSEYKTMIDKCKSSLNELINNLNKINVKKVKNFRQGPGYSSVKTMFNTLNDHEDMIFTEIEIVDNFIKKIEDVSEFDSNTKKDIISNINSTMTLVANVSKVYYAKFTIIENALEFNINQGLYPGFSYSKKSDEDLDDF